MSLVLQFSLGAKQSCDTTIREQSEQLHSRAELVGVHVDIPLRDLNAGMPSQGS